MCFEVRLSGSSNNGLGSVSPCIHRKTFGQVLAEIVSHMDTPFANDPMLHNCSRVFSQVDLVFGSAHCSLLCIIRSPHLGLGGIPVKLMAALVDLSMYKY